MEKDFKPWAWAVIDYSTAILYEADKDPEEGCIMDIHPCGSCMERAKESGNYWKWGLCTTPSEANAKLIAAAPELLEALQRVIDKGWAPIKDKEFARAAINKALHP